MVNVERDERRKLSDLDYKQIRFAVMVEDRTIREVANSFAVSTKYVKRILTNATRTDTIATTVCSGCGWSYSDIGSHYQTWTSGGIHELTCGTYAP